MTVSKFLQMKSASPTPLQKQPEAPFSSQENKGVLLLQIDCFLTQADRAVWLFFFFEKRAEF